MSFPHIDAEKRTDTGFRNRANPEHHREYSIIEELPINMIDDFVTSDSLHLLHLGVMKKLLLIWLGESDKFEFRWTKDDIMKMDNLLTKCNEDMPADIHRAVRTLNCIKFWKGTEFCLILQYVGIVILKQTLREKDYLHFLKLYCAVILCSNNKYLKFLNLAKILFEEFIEEYIELYGINSIGSNVHNLSHIVEDVKRFGNLTKINTYPFENALFGLKLRTCNRPLEQISRRILEHNLDYREPVVLSCILQNENNDPEFKYLIESNEKDSQCYKQISLGSDSFLSSRKFGDKWFLTNDDKIVEFNFATKREGKIVLNGTGIRKAENFFTDPFSSKNINIYMAESENNELSNRYYDLKNVKAKMMCLHYGDKLVFSPLLHTL